MNRFKDRPVGPVLVYSELRPSEPTFIRFSYQVSPRSEVHIAVLRFQLGGNRIVLAGLLPHLIRDRCRNYLSFCPWSHRTVGPSSSVVYSRAYSTSSPLKGTGAIYPDARTEPVYRTFWYGYICTTGTVWLKELQGTGTAQVSCCRHR